MTRDQSILLNSETIRENITYSQLIETLDHTFESYENGNATMPPKSYINIQEYNGDFRSMPAYIHSNKISGSGIKWVNVHPDNKENPSVMGIIIYNDPETGFPLAVLNGTEITGLRTGGASGVATDHLAPTDITTLGIIGAGAQAYEQVRSIESVRTFDQILVSDLDDTRVNLFRQEFENEFEVQRKSPREVMNNSEVVSTITPVQEPIISKDIDLPDHINAIGADAPEKQEFSVDLISNSNLHLIVDDYEQALHSGELSKAYEKDLIDKSDVTTIGKVISDNLTFDGPTLFDSTGLAIQDVATADLIYTSLSENQKQNLPKFSFI